MSPSKILGVSGFHISGLYYWLNSGVDELPLLLCGMLVRGLLVGRVLGGKNRKGENYVRNTYIFPVWTAALGKIWSGVLGVSNGYKFVGL